MMLSVQQWRTSIWCFESKSNLHRE